MSTPTALISRFAEDDKRQLRDDVQRVLATPEGRRVLIAIIGLGDVYAPVGPCNGSPVDLAYQTGRRDAAAKLLAFCNSADRHNVQLAAQERTALQMKRDQSINDCRKETVHEQS
jgi:hypothetical protein